VLRLVVPRRLYLARHGETEWNAIGRLQGHTDIPLNERGRRQARDLAEAMRTHEVGEVITSDLLRSHQTGQIVADVLGLAAPRVIPELRERRFGVFEGLTRSQCLARYPEAWAAWHAQTGVPEGAEALADATARMHTVLGTLLDTSALVISHGGVMRLFLLDIFGQPPPPMRNGTTYVVEHDGDRFRAKRIRM
jgi:broad specificity phosphatase PhoE